MRQHLPEECDVAIGCCHGNKRSFIPQGNKEESPGDDVRRRLSSQIKHHLWRRGAGGRMGDEGCEGGESVCVCVFGWWGLAADKVAECKENKHLL